MSELGIEQIRVTFTQILADLDRLSVTLKSELAPLKERVAALEQQSSNEDFAHKMSDLEAKVHALPDYSAALYELKSELSNLRDTTEGLQVQLPARNTAEVSELKTQQEEVEKRVKVVEEKIGAVDAFDKRVVVLEKTPHNLPYFRRLYTMTAIALGLGALALVIFILLAIFRPSTTVRVEGGAVLHTSSAAAMDNTALEKQANAISNLQKQVAQLAKQVEHNDSTLNTHSAQLGELMGNKGTPKPTPVGKSAPIGERALEQKVATLESEVQRLQSRPPVNEEALTERVLDEVMRRYPPYQLFIYK